MKSCHTYREMMKEALFGHMDDRDAAAFSVHLASCPDCAAELKRLQNTVALLEREGPPDTEKANYERIWENLEMRMDRQENKAGRRGFWYIGAPLLAAVLVMALFNLLAPPTGSRPAPPKPAPQELVHYLNKTQPLLLAIANHGPGRGTATGFDFQWERGRASELADEALVLRQTLRGREGRTMLDLLGDIELLLLQIANLNDTDYESGMALVQSFMESRTILFKISLIEMRHGLT